MILLQFLLGALGPRRSEPGEREAVELVLPGEAVAVPSVDCSATGAATERWIAELADGALSQIALVLECDEDDAVLVLIATAAVRYRQLRSGWDWIDYQITARRTQVLLGRGSHGVKLIDGAEALPTLAQALAVLGAEVA